MLYKLFKIDETSKSSAIRVAAFNLVVTFLLTASLVVFVGLIFHYYDVETATHMARLIWVEVVMNFLFFPFSLVLIFGIKNDRYHQIRIWVKAKVVQASYLFLLNVVLQVYITVSLSFDDGLIVLVYTLVSEAFYLETIIFMNNYYRNKVAEDKSTELPEKIAIPDKFILRF